MPLLAVGRLYPEHVFCILDGIAECSAPLQIVRKDGRKWVFLYVSYASENLMLQAVTDLSIFVEKNWSAYTKSPPFVCASRDLALRAFRVFIKDTPVGMGSSNVISLFEREADLLAWDEIDAVPNLGGFFINFIDFEEAMSYVRRSEKGELLMRGVNVCVRPQKNLMLMMKVFARMQSSARNFLTMQDLRDVAERFAVQDESSELFEMLAHMPKIFEKISAKEDTEPDENTDIYRLHTTKEKLLLTYNMNRVQQLETMLETMTSLLCVLLRDMACRIGKTKTWQELLVAIHGKHPSVELLLGECPDIFAQDCSKWTAPRIIVALCSSVIRAELRTVHCLSMSHTEAPWHSTEPISPQLLADEHLVADKKMRSSGYRRMLINPKGELLNAAKALHVCLDILTWNAYLSRKSFQCLSNIIQHSNDVITAATSAKKE